MKIKVEEEELKPGWAFEDPDSVSPPLLPMSLPMLVDEIEEMKRLNYTVYENADVKPFPDASPSQDSDLSDITSVPLPPLTSPDSTTHRIKNLPPLNDLKRTAYGIRKAYTRVLTWLEKAGTEKNKQHRIYKEIHARALGFLILYAPTDFGAFTAGREINNCPEDKWLVLAERTLDIILRACENHLYVPILSTSKT